MKYHDERNNRKKAKNLVHFVTQLLPSVTNFSMGSNQKYNTNRSD